ncbi:helix-turn-helix domain-containing protein [Bacillus pumilus]|uniref:ABC transporter substrate-binding protein n=1 Tax=Bacillus pumilus TaxID=1408 RepID=A0AAD0MK14_BACPU|nr:AraC family transcriptional regulator [Bacillus pumilus]AVM23039.1 ABC transporter substrate-binding protein [Bacillus pumilus]TYS43493.1 helix-turn-helix domain-containing protein [Bacillus pumilus]
MTTRTHTILRMKESRERSLSVKQTVSWLTASPMFLTSDGSVLIEMEGLEYELNAKDSMLIRSGINVIIQSLSSEQVVIHTVIFDQFTLANDAQNELVYKVNYDDLPDNGEIVKGSATLFSYIKQMKRSQSIQEQVKWLEDIMRIFQRQSKPYTEKVHYSIEMILQYMAEHYEQKLTRKDLAHKMGFHESYFSTFFKQSMGQSVTDYIAQIRIDEAKKRLLQTDDQIQMIARQVGYTDSLYFSRIFKQKTGRSPSQFRNNRRPERIAAFQFAGSLVALGIRPVCIDRETFLHSDILKDQLPGSLVIDEHTPDDIFKSLQLDLIIIPNYYYSKPALIKRLERIAPVLVLPYGGGHAVQEVLFTGRLLGREKEADDWVRRFEYLSQKARDDLSSFREKGETVAIYEMRGHDKVYIWSYQARGSFYLYETLGLKPPKAIQEEVLRPNQHTVIPLERLREYEADHMFFIAGVQHGWYEQMDKRLEESDVLRQLSAVKNGTFYPLKLEEFRFDEGERALLLINRFVSKLTQKTYPTIVHM